VGQVALVAPMTARLSRILNMWPGWVISMPATAAIRSPRIIRPAAMPISSPIPIPSYHAVIAALPTAVSNAGAWLVVLDHLQAMAVHHGGGGRRQGDAHLRAVSIQPS